MQNMTKSQKRHLRELAVKAYEIELSSAIEAVHQSIQKWKKNEISCWDTDQEIHNYHDNVARDLYKTYVMLNDPEFAVTLAIAKGILNISEVREDCRQFVEGLLILSRE
jgi:hypothetical protein